MPKLFNVDHQPQVIDYTKRAVMPGESHDFTDDEIAAGLSGSWSENDPREGLTAEKAFKKRRDEKDDNAPAEPGETKESDGEK